MPNTESRTTKLLIDTDPGIDDIMAILLALVTPKVEVCSITLTHGNTTLENVKRNLLTIFHVLDRQAEVTGKDIYKGSRPRISIGSSHPLKGSIFTAEDFHGRDGMGNITITHPHLMDPEWESRLGSDKRHHRYETSQLNAVDEIIWQLNNHPPNTLIILALGPLTNIAMVIEKDPGVLKRAKKIVSMGGAIFAPGNVTPLGEFNFYADPHAASVVLNATKGGALNLVLVPLDITHTSYLFQDFAVARLGNVVEPLAEMFLNMLRDGFKFTAEMDGLDAIALHDPLAAAIALDLVHPEMKKLAVLVECESTLTYGACIVDRRFNPPAPLTDKDPQVNVCLTFPEPEKFQAKLLDAIFPPKATP